MTVDTTPSARGTTALLIERPGYHLHAEVIAPDRAEAPWIVVKSDCKKRGRLNALRYVLHRLPYPNKDLTRIGKIDPLIAGRASAIYEKGEHGGPVV